MANINVSITHDFRLISDERNYIVQKRCIVDPTKAPGYKAEEGVEAPPMREEWKDNGYYTLNHRGFVCAIDHVMRRSVGGDATDIAGLFAEYNAEAARLRTLITAATGVSV